MKSIIVWIVLILIIIAGGWYWMSMGQGTAGPTATTTPSTAMGLNGSPDQTNTGLPSVPPVVTVANDATLGGHLVALNGMTLYMFTKDTAGVSNCSGACAVLWPAYNTPMDNEPLVAGDGVTGTLASITRADGTTQVTYNGMPLYFYAKDSKVGDTTGQNVGKVWFIVKP